jgi:hypothetical protein
VIGNVIYSTVKPVFKMQELHSVELGEEGFKN